jgi:hypothetical protein
LHITAHLGTANSLASNGWTDRFKRDNIVYRNLSGESRSVDPETVEDWINDQLLHETEGYDLRDTHNADETSPFFNLQPSKTFTFRDFCHGGIKSEQRVTVLTQILG